MGWKENREGSVGAEGVPWGCPLAGGGVPGGVSHCRSSWCPPRTPGGARIRLSAAGAPSSRAPRRSREPSPPARRLRGDTGGGDTGLRGAGGDTGIWGGDRGWGLTSPEAPQGVGLQQAGDEVLSVGGQRLVPLRPQDLVCHGGKRGGHGGDIVGGMTTTWGHVNAGPSTTPGTGDRQPHGPTSVPIVEVPCGCVPVSPSPSIPRMTGSSPTSPYPCVRVPPCPCDPMSLG